MGLDHDLHLTGDEAADRLLSDNPLALMIGMLLDQQVPMEWAFASPVALEERLGAPLRAEVIAERDVEAIEAIFRQRPALHRYPGSMAKRVHALCGHLVEEYAGEAEQVWRKAADGADLLRRVNELPGFGDQKSQIFVALLAKQLGVRPDGWDQAAGDYAKDGFRSIADVTGPEALEKVREHKRLQKAAVRN